MTRMNRYLRPRCPPF